MRAEDIRGGGESPRYDGLLELEVSEVHVSGDVLGQDFSEDSRVVVVFELRSLRGQALDLRASRLSIGGGSGSEPARAPLATGSVSRRRGSSMASTSRRSRSRLGGPCTPGPPSAVSPKRRARELPARVEVFWPGGTALVLSDPGRSEPWQSEPKLFASGYGFLWTQLSADEAALPQAITSQWVVAPYVGGEAALLLSNVRVALVHWFGDDRDLPSFGASSGISLTL